MFADSARFSQIHVDSIGVDPGATLTIDSAEINKLNVTNLIIDSATINRLTVGTADIANATIDSADINRLEVTTFVIDSAELQHAKQFLIKDQSGTIVFNGYVLSTSNSLGVL